MSTENKNRKRKDRAQKLPLEFLKFPKMQSLRMSENNKNLKNSRIPQKLTSLPVNQTLLRLKSSLIIDLEELKKMPRKNLDL